jgi:hypothetical protein
MDITMPSVIHGVTRSCYGGRRERIRRFRRGLRGSERGLCEGWLIRERLRRMAGRRLPGRGRSEASVHGFGECADRG